MFSIELLTLDLWVLERSDLPVRGSEFCFWSASVLPNISSTFSLGETEDWMLKKLWYRALWPRAE